jgi:hypothetical protein
LSHDQSLLSGDIYHDIQQGSERQVRSADHPSADGFVGARAGVFVVAWPSPIFRAPDQTGPHRVMVTGKKGAVPALG